MNNKYNFLLILSCEFDILTRFFKHFNTWKSKKCKKKSISPTNVHNKWLQKVIDLVSGDSIWTQND